MDFLLGGFFVLFAADLGLLEDVEANAAPDSALARGLEGFYEKEHANSTRSAGEFWLWWVGEAISATIPAESDSGLLGNNDGTLMVYLASDGEGELSDGEHPLPIASGVAHELAHSFPDYDHVACWNGAMSCDADRNGAFGVGMTFMVSWMENGGAGASVMDCEQARQAIVRDCSYVIDWDGLPWCNDPDLLPCGVEPSG